MSLTIILKAIELGLIFSILSLGVYISFRVLNVPDLTVDGSFATGCAVCAVMTIAGHPYLGLLLAFVAGGLCGMVTAFLQTKMHMQPLLAGILTMVALYSINLRIMSGAPNISLFSTNTLFTLIDSELLILLIFSLVIGFVLFGFFKTNLGLILRATGDNEVMVRSSSINVDRMKFIGMALSNGIVALSGALLAQYQNFADITSGTGMMVLGLAGIIIGEALLRKRTIGFGIASAIIGACIYRLLYQFALQFGIPATDMNLMSAILVAITISLPYLKRKGVKHVRA
ncbi:ABC transporter permease [Faecalitalea cylindroides]|uniref:ABC transporter permease n=1 Tax=Faecalitalea cylindroides TaxID=39483 RepID=UPI00189713CD|nr:ABC transporter permease [Faecalitalea cylindroides]MDB7947475.1 ABC transporter permease [Faecalitalea cylindroides]MDB7949291.1 ABC transporter permease [Faecalitalea cylindroides]MDB7951217.1 ABC transporter permease [Faecalitalea cylindroides]